MKIAIYTLGCKVNQYESQVLAELFEKDGFEVVDFDDKADAYIINTCSVTGESDRKSRQMIRRAASKNPGALICATGCYSQLNPDKIMALGAVDIVTGTKDRAGIVNLVKENIGKKPRIKSVSDVMEAPAFEHMKLGHTQQRTRTSIKIQDGCENFCSYCVIPFARGPVVSKPYEDIKTELLEAIGNGYYEIVLTGIHISSYGADMGYEKTLSDVLLLCESLEGDFRIRLGSLNLSCFTDEFIEIAAGMKKLCPHFHISLQSGCDRTLEAMNRRYSAEEFYQVMLKIKAVIPGAAITTDVIAGFPAETDEDFEKSLSFVKKAGFSKVHVFPYSSRPGTKAAGMQDKVGKNIKGERAKRLRAAAGESERAFMNDQIDKEFLVLFEEKIGSDTYRGVTPNYQSVIVRSKSDISRRTLDVKITGVKGSHLIGELV